MRSNQFRNGSTAPVFFSSRKCKVAIPVRHILLRDALQQASLEPSVRAIRYRQTPDLHGTQASLTGVVIDRIDGDFLLVVCETRPRRSAEELVRLGSILERNGLRLLERDAFDIRREPLFSNARTVWSYERYHVPLNDRLRIAAVLAEDGPQSIIEIEERACPTCDIIAAVCAMACEDLLEFNIQEAPLGPSSMVRGR
ncbi:hypothetical protein V1294_006744 [Bradyrhizobium sp. AZCC 1678]|uniref:hypothetical protein n=1 Tax=Bradyrhizobium sp. AZCC 1678 TaxID=3117030 RepID=UPI002FF1E1F3